MKVYKEILNHFACDECRRWWSIASVSFDVGQAVHCPWCGDQNTISEVSSSDNLKFSHASNSATNPAIATEGGNNDHR